MTDMTASSIAPSDLSAPDRPAARRGGGAVVRSLRAAGRTRRGQIGGVLVLFVLLVAFVGPFVGGHPPTGFVAPPFTKPGVDHSGLLGTDVLGRGVLPRILHGGRTLLLLAFASTALAVASGAVLGVTAAYRRGWVETVTMRGVDVALAVPQLVFALILMSVIGPRWWLLIIAVGISQAPQTARVVYAAAQNVCERDFVHAVAIWGVPPRTVLRRHVLPNLTMPLMVELGLRLSFSIVLIAGLSFLGFGPQPPSPDWGVMINENRLGLAANPWGVLAPAIMLALLAVGTNMFADALARANLGEIGGEEAVMNSALDAGPGA